MLDPNIVDISGPLRASLERVLAQARSLEADGRNPEAAAKYVAAAGVMTQLAGVSQTRADQQRRREKAAQYLEYAERLKNDKRRPAPPAAAPSKSAKPAADDGAPHADRAAGSGTQTAPEYSPEIAALIHRSKITWDRIGGLEETKREIKFTYGLALAQKPDAVKLAGWRRMLFYGPPGTGKTLLAAATSNGLGATFFNVKASNLLSKYFGESSRLVTALFDAARSESDAGFAVVFIDEIESLCMARGEGSDSGAERRMLSTLLSEMDGLADKGEDRFVLTIAATNTPWDLDDAVLSRFQKRIYIPLPDAVARESILQIQLKGYDLDFPISDLVERTASFSGRDLERLANQAVSIMVEDLNSGIPKVVDQGRDAIEGYRIKVRGLGKSDFDKAFERIRVDTDRYRRLEERYKEFSGKN
jgi:katanin p60 ATPase-containing subunit A1